MRSRDIVVRLQGQASQPSRRRPTNSAPIWSSRDRSCDPATGCGSTPVIRSRGDVPLWSDRFDRELKDIFAIQDEISRAIVNKLRLTLAAVSADTTRIVEAYQLYLKGRALVGRRGSPASRRPRSCSSRSREGPGVRTCACGAGDAYAFMSVRAAAAIAVREAQSIMRPAAVKAPSSIRCWRRPMRRWVGCTRASATGRAPRKPSSGPSN